MPGTRNGGRLAPVTWAAGMRARYPAAPVTIDPQAANSVSCLSATFCVAGDSIRDAFARR